MRINNPIRFGATIGPFDQRPDKEVKARAAARPDAENLNPYYFQADVFDTSAGRNVRKYFLALGKRDIDLAAKASDERADRYELRRDNANETLDYLVGQALPVSSLEDA